MYFLTDSNVYIILLFSLSAIGYIHWLITRQLTRFVASRVTGLAQRLNPWLVPLLKRLGSIWREGDC